jgi:hypothetical protein
VHCAGVALDDLVYLCTKIARQFDTQGMERVFEAMESARAAIDDAKPLLSQAVKLSDEVINRQLQPDSSKGINYAAGFAVVDSASCTLS